MQILHGVDQIDVRIDSFHLSKTYLGLLEGTPDQEVNQEVVERFTRSLQKIWGERALLIIWPKGDFFSEPADVFPDWVCAAWITSDFSPIETDDGSELVIVWFEATIPHASIESSASRVLRVVDWKNQASGFRF